MEEQYMRRAIELARKGMGHVSPNPMVGCVIVKDGRIISEGYHEKYGAYHAERNALLCCKEDAEGAEAYVTLEPCCHYGKTPPCTEILIEKKIKKVYIGSKDPNPLVAGKGAAILREHGIEVEEGVLKEECDQMNEIFFHYITQKTPFVSMKYAMTLDGKIACATGDSKWVTGPEARQFVQLLRKQHSGIMAGIQTVLLDDPMLNCRLEDGVDPVRIICDSHLRLPLESNLVKTADRIKTYAAFCEKSLTPSEAGRKEALLEKGVHLMEAGGENGRIDLTLLMKKLGEEKIDSILLEGGGTLNASAISSGIVNKVYAFIAPKLVGGREARSPVEGLGIRKMEAAVKLSQYTLERFGEDICVIGRIK